MSSRLNASFIFLLTFLCYSNCFKGRKLSLQEQFEVVSLAEKLVKDNGSVLKGLFDFASVAGGMSCSVCSFTVDVLKNYLLQKNGIEKFYALMEQICHFTKIDDRVCDGAIAHYGDIVGAAEDADLFEKLVKEGIKVKRYF